MDRLFEHIFRWGVLASASLYALIHLLLLAGLANFGQVAGGYPLEPLTLLVYGLLAAWGTALAVWLTVRSWSGAGPRQLLPLLALTLFLTTALIGTFYATERLAKMPGPPAPRFGLRTAYVPFLDDDGGFGMGSFSLATWLIGLALAARWRPLLVGGMAAQGLALLSNPGLWLPTLRYGLHGDGYGLLALPVLYLGAALMFGWRPKVGHVWVSVALFLGGFLLAGLFTLQVFPYMRVGLERSADPNSGLWLMNNLLVTGWFYAFVLGLPVFAWRLRAWAKGGDPPSWRSAAAVGLVLLAWSALLSWKVLPPVWLGDSRRIPEELYGAAGGLLGVAKVAYPWLLGTVAVTWLTSILRTSWPSIVDAR